MKFVSEKLIQIETFGVVYGATMLSAAIFDYIGDGWLVWFGAAVGFAGGIFLRLTDPLDNSREIG